MGDEDKETANNSENKKGDSETRKNGNEKGENMAKWGYDLYPERKGEKYKPSWTNIFFKGQGREDYDKIKCERNVYKCIKNSLIVKLMMGALKSSGCEIDIRRHIACEYCDPVVTGGYDPILNQIVICQNTVKKEGIVQGILAHEMIHMFDYCNNKVDFKNIDHLACTEIRAANLTHCSFFSACTQGDASLFRIKKAHEACVKSKAMFSIINVRSVTKEQAMEAINRVFPKCYNDLEPIGRRIRRNSTDMQRAYFEGSLYGYV